jgi:dGTP triphosphohydrolase
MVFLPRKQQGLCSVYPPTRVVCDYVAGMTDEYAARVFREIKKGEIKYVK